MRYIRTEQLRPLKIYTQNNDRLFASLKIKSRRVI